MNNIKASAANCVSVSCMRAYASFNCLVASVPGIDDVTGSCAPRTVISPDKTLHHTGAHSMHVDGTAPIMAGSKVSSIRASRVYVSS